jgi:NAD(P)-dependent dehydrogenase (short-subunit alcohol dehydrogenase family)
MLSGRTALVTGGSSGIGYAVAAALAGAGADVMIAGRDPERGRRAVTALTAAMPAGRLQFTRADVSDEPSVRDLVAATADTFGPIAFLFNNAGVEGALGPLADYPLESIDEILATNVKGAFLCLKHVLPGMQTRGSGVIVNTASFVGTIVPFPDGALYGASKAAVISLTQSAAVASAEHNVRVFAVCPWITDTPMIDRLTGHQVEAKRQFGAINPSGAIVTPAEVAAVVVRLFSGDEALDNGGAILVDSGGTIQRIRPATAQATPS